MSRSGYSDCDCDINEWKNIMWRGAVKSAFRGKRGQAFLREMLAAFDALPEKRLVSNVLEDDGEVCALGAVGKARGLDMSRIDPEDSYAVAAKLNVSPAMAREFMFENDEAARYWRDETPEQRFIRMRAWVASQIKEAM